MSENRVVSISALSEQDLLNLAIGDEIISSNKYDRVLRVPGGWIYRTVGKNSKGIESIATAVFVPEPPVKERRE